jgi:hypothetical protein
MSEICRQLEDENHLLQVHLSKIDPDFVYSPTVTPTLKEKSSSSTGSPTLSFPKNQSSAHLQKCTDVTSTPSAVPSKKPGQRNDQISTLLKAANVFDERPPTGKRDLPGCVNRLAISELLTSVAQNLVALSDDSSASGESHAESLEEGLRTPKRQRVSNTSAIISHPITPQATATVGC